MRLWSPRTGPVGAVTFCAIASLTNLVSVSVGANKLSGTLDALFALPKLSFLMASVNKFNSSLPLVIEATQLVSLFLGSNKLTGAVPVALAALPRLATLSLTWNSGLNGTLPAFTSPNLTCALVVV